MVWHRNAGQDTNEILQNRFTAYLLSAVQRRRAAYIDVKVKECQICSLDEKICEDRKFDLDREAFKSFPLLMKLQNEKLFQSLTELSERERYVLLNRALDEKSFEELGWELGLSYKGVAAIYYRTIQKVKKENERGDDMSFQEILLRAKVGDEKAKLDLLEKYKPMLIKNSIINGYFDEDLYQEQCLVLMRCIDLFSIDSCKCINR